MYLLKFDYRQPASPDLVKDLSKMPESEKLYFIYIPLKNIKQKDIEKTKLLEIIRNIYFETYLSCANEEQKEIYIKYLENIICRYEKELPEYILMVPTSRD